MTSIITGFKKITSTPPPHFEEIKSTLLKTWAIIDSNENGVIEFIEFETWVESSDEIQDMLIKYIKFQMKSHALKLYHVYIEELNKLFFASLSSNSEKAFYDSKFIKDNQLAMCSKKVYAL
jgi:hypothetical protein